MIGTGDVVLVPRDQLPPPSTAGGLLTDLGLEDADAKRQAAAVTEWLAENEPNEMLRWSLSHHGLI